MPHLPGGVRLAIQSVKPLAALTPTKARELEQAIRDSTCVVNGFGNKLCGDDAGAYCDLQWSNLDADSRDACQGLVSQSTLDEQQALDNLANAP